MYEIILSFFLSHPHRLVLTGPSLVKLAGFIVVAGLIGRAVTTAHGTLPPTALLPNLPMWRVLETTPGFTAAAMLAVTAIAMAKMGRKWERYLRSPAMDSKRF